MNKPREFNKPVFCVYLEGGLHHEARSLKVASRVAERCRAEGYLAEVHRETKTILGSMRVRVA